MATAILDLKGLRLDKVSVSVVFSDNQDAVQNAFDIRKRNPATYSTGRAALQDLRNGTARATFIFPHRDHPGAGGKVYPSHTKVFYAWAEDFVPTGATTTLTINSPVRSFDMPRFLIIAYIGDSYAAGEGAPNEAGPGKAAAARWDNEECHRSKRSGGALGLERLKEKHPEWAIRYVNVTCSGATLFEFTEARIRPSVIGGVGSSEPAQFLQIANWLKDNNRKVVDILLADGGGNDVGFAPIATSGFTAFISDISKDETVKAQVRDGLSGLAGGYDTIDAKIKSEFYGFSVGRVVWMNYPNPLTDKNGKLCSPQSQGLCWGPLERQITDTDMVFLRDSVFVPLNKEVKKAAEKYGWDLVDISQRSVDHGICNCEVPFFNTLGQALWIQGDASGTMHPNARGYRMVWRDPVLQQLERSIALWHAELKEDNRDRAIAKAKEKAAAMTRAQAAQAAAAQKPTKVLVKQRPLPEGPKPQGVQLDPEDMKPIRQGHDESNR